MTQSESRLVADGRGAAKRHPESVRLGEYAGVLAAEARETWESFEPPPLSAVDRHVLERARGGVGLVVSFYVSARTGDRQASFTGEELEPLHRVTNDWLIMYARRYGVDLNVNLTVREAAEVLLRTYDVVDTAQLLTCVSEWR